MAKQRDPYTKMINNRLWYEAWNQRSVLSRFLYVAGSVIAGLATGTAAAYLVLTLALSATVATASFTLLLAVASGGAIIGLALGAMLCYALLMATRKPTSHTQRAMNFNLNEDVVNAFDEETTLSPTITPRYSSKVRGQPATGEGNVLRHTVHSDPTETATGSQRKRNRRNGSGSKQNTSGLSKKGAAVNVAKGGSRSGRTTRKKVSIYCTQ